MPNDARVASSEVQVTASEVQVTSSEGQVTSREVQTTSREVGELLKANTSLLVWLVFLALGGGTLALYYARIGYLPDIEWKSSIIYLFAASFIGGGVGLLLALSLLLPGYIWAEFVVFDDELVEVFCYDKAGKEPCVQAILYNIGTPFGVVLLISHIALITGVTNSVIAVVLLIIILVIAFLFIRHRFEQIVPNTSVSPERERRIFKYSFWFTLSVLLNQVSMLVIYRLSGRPEGFRFIRLTLVCTAGVLITTLVVAVRYRRYPRQAIAASLVAASLLFFAADRFSSLSQRIMAHFGLGQTVNLLVNDEGAAIIEKLGLYNISDPSTRETLGGVKILSKIGSEYYLKLDDGRTLTLPKSTVKSLISTKANVTFPD